MDIQKSFQILEIDPSASIDDAKQAYKIQVKFYHPDRFVEDPQQKQKAEEKLKEVNLAYEQVKSFLSNPNKERRTWPEPDADMDSYKAKARTQTETQTKDTKESGATAIKSVQKVFNFFYKKLRQMDFNRIFDTDTNPDLFSVKDNPSKNKPGFTDILRGMDKHMGRKMGSGMGRGRGMGKCSGRGKRWRKNG
ncbi:MAG: DnaJ domain-containing protein [Deltaproteobacteria bacterium]|nr:DnaJ domain-containing protein [Deltaproteobacteria bacterium]